VSPPGIKPISLSRISRAAAAALIVAGALAAAPLDRRVIARTEGNDLPTARRVAAALLAHERPAQIMWVRCERVGVHVDCGIVLSGVKFHRELDVAGWNAEVADLVGGAFSAAPQLDEVDCWATVPLAVGRGAVVSGDYAQPTSATVFSVTVPRRHRTELAARLARGSGVFWDPAFRASLAKGTRE
jgi:hypothetical protein